MNVAFPYTNPIVFSRLNAYHNYQDAYHHEANGCFVQPFAHGDLITFQIHWRKAMFGVTHTLAIDIVVNNTRHSFRSYSLHDNCSGGTFYSSYYKQVRRITNVNGYYVFANRVNSICAHGTTPLVQPTNRFYFVVTIDGEEFFSNTLQYITDTAETKLLHYHHSNAYQFDTDFTIVPQGYDVRLPACFLHPQPAAYKEVFESYQRDLELIAATPFENIELEIGRRRGIPDWWIRNLNFIFHCDNKSIDGIEYELTSAATLTPEYPEQYNFSFLRIEMAQKKNALSYQQHITYNHDFPQTEDDAPIIIVVVAEKDRSITNKELNLTAAVTIQTNERWYVSDSGNGKLLTTKIVPLSGKDKTIIQLTMDRKVFAESSTLEFLIKREEDGKDLYIVKVLPPTTKVGISYGSVGDTLFVAEQLVIN